MKILTIHNDYQVLGGETVAYKAEVQLLKDKGHTIIEYLRHNSEIFNLNFWQKAGFSINTVYSLKTYKEIRKIITTEKPDIAHVHNVFPLISPSVYYALSDAKIPMIQTLHNVRFLCPNGLFFTHGEICERCKFGNTFHAVRYKCYREDYLLSLLYAVTIGMHRRVGTFNKIDQFIALTDFALTKMAESGLVDRNKISILGNFLPESLPEPKFVKTNEQYIAFMGRISKEKGVESLINTANQLRNLRFKIAGAGKEIKYYQDIIAKNQQSNIEFVGHLSGNDKWEFLRNAKCLVVPSLCYENFPLVILESMAVGTPVVASNIGSLPHIVNHGETGLLFEPGNSEDLLDKLNHLLSSEEFSTGFGNAAYEYFNSKWTASAHYRELLQIYQRFI